MIISIRLCTANVNVKLILQSGEQSFLTHLCGFFLGWLHLQFPMVAARCRVCHQLDIEWV